MNSRAAAVAALTIAFLVIVAGASARPSEVSAAHFAATSLVTFTNGGGVLEISDGSVWAISSDGQGTVTGWTLGDTIGENPIADTLNDLDTGDTVAAQKIGEMTAKRHYAHVGERTIESIGNDGTVVVLTDRSVWAVPATKDAEIVDAWTYGALVTVKATTRGAYLLRVTDPRDGSLSRKGRLPALAYYIGNTPKT
jgi:hypothetical protein